LLDKIGLLANRINRQGPAPVGRAPCLARIGARQQAAPATVRAIAGDRVLIRLESRQAAVTPGQAVTSYQGDSALGGGWIEGALDGPQLKPLE
jgi:tRNA-specific 2-thiouridylase